MQQPPIVVNVEQLAQEFDAIKSARKHIFEVLSLRLGTNVEQGFKSELDAIDDLQLLEALFVKALQVDNIEEFKQALEKSDISF